MLRRESGTDGIEFVFAFNREDGTQIRWALGAYKGAQHKLYKRTPEGDIDIDLKDGELPSAEWQPVKIDLSDGKIRCYYNNVLIHEAKIPDVVAARPKPVGAPEGAISLLKPERGAPAASAEGTFGRISRSGISVS